MRVIYLHQYFVTPDQPGGTRSFEMARRLVAAGHQVDMITSDQRDGIQAKGWRVTDEAGIRVHWVHQPYNNSMGWLGRIKAFFQFAFESTVRAHSIRDADIIFATSTPLTIAIPAMIAAWRRKIPYVFEVRDVWPAVPIAMGALRNPALKWAARRLEHIAYHHAAHVVALAPGMGEEVARTGYPESRITIIPNGCDSEIFDGDPVGDAGILSGHTNWLGDHPLILFSGTLGKANGVSYLCDIAAAMRHRNPDVRFCIIGNGADRNNIARRAEELGVLDQTLKMIPAIPKRELAAWVRRATLTIALFSGPRILWKDAVQNKFFDALAAGKPVFSNHDGWQCQIAAEHDVGGVIHDQDPEAAAAHLLERANDTVWLQGVANRARQLAYGPFSRNILAQKLERCLSQVSQGHRSR